MQTKQQLKALKQKRDEVNGIICSRNLYAVQDVTGQLRRVYNCEVFLSGDGIHVLTVEDLQTEHKYFVAQTKFQDGYGSEVLL